jgi:hypothetical protein
MSRPLRATLLGLCVATALTACNSGRESGNTVASTASTEGAPTIESSLEGFAVLPPRIRWSVTTSLPSAQVRAVHFNVDHGRVWVDRSPPYTYGPEGAYLPTRWVSSLGESGHLHTFKARVIATNGEEWNNVVRARTPEANVARHAPGNFGNFFGGYFGHYGYGRLSAADLADPPHELLWLPSYTGRLVFVGASLFTGEQGEYAWEISSDGKHVYLGTPIYLDSTGGPGSWYGYRELTEVLCAPDGPPATYAWSAMRGRRLSSGYHSRYLHLRAVNEPCDKRRRMLEGVWDEIQD